VRSTKSPSWSSRLLGLGPLAPPPHAFALAPERLVYAGFARDGGRFRFREYHAEPLAPDTFQKGLLGGPPRDPVAFDGVLGRLLERIGAPVKEASLILPDAWLRLAFAESGALPPGSRERDEVLRWKLKRLVPFRVDELRLDAVAVAPLPGVPADPAEPDRLLLGFAVEALLAQLEHAWERAGVRLGRITSTSLAVLGALDGSLAPGEGSGLTALVLADEEEYSLTVARAGEPVLHRSKGLAEGLPLSARGELVRRDLALTRNFLEQQLPGEPAGRTLFSGSAGSAREWLDWLTEGLGVAAEVLGEEHLPPVEGVATPLDWHELAPLLGAVRAEVN
jgi:hypothetical protein